MMLCIVDLHALTTRQVRGRHEMLSIILPNNFLFALKSISHIDFIFVWNNFSKIFTCSSRFHQTVCQRWTTTRLRWWQQCKWWVWWCSWDGRGIGVRSSRSVVNFAVEMFSANLTEDETQVDLWALMFSWFMRSLSNSWILIAAGFYYLLHCQLRLDLVQTGTGITTLNRFHYCTFPVRFEGKKCDNCDSFLVNCHFVDLEEKFDNSRITATFCSHSGFRGFVVSWYVLSVYRRIFWSANRSPIGVFNCFSQAFSRFYSWDSKVVTV